MKTKTGKELLKYIFTVEEKKEIASEMAEKVSERKSTEDDKKAVMSDYKSRIDGLDATINVAANKITTGYEMRQIDCEYVPDLTTNVWRVLRIDTGEMVRNKKMSEEDLQYQIDLP